MRQLQPGDIVDRRYKIEALIGVGGMGEVYRARRTRLGDIVTIKVIRTRSGDARTRRRRFMAEARMCAMLHHPYIVSVLDFGVEPGVGPYLVMEYLNGPSLRQELAARGAFDVPEVCRIATQVASALDLAHSQGIVHLDLKPGNMMTHRYSAGEIVYKVIDFGIGGIGPLRADASMSPSSSRTRSAADDDRRILVTMAYASPEQLSGEPVTSRSDLYSLGVTIYELLTGNRPFTASDSRSLITKHLRELPEPPTRHRPDIPSWAEAAVLRALAKDPQSRWETASDFARALSGAAETRPTAVAMSTSPLVDVYELGELVGRGRLESHIYRAIHRATGHAVAIRVILRGQSVDWAAARISFMREARMTPVNDPSILRVRDYGEERDLVYVVTDFVPGSSLREVLDREKAFSWNVGSRFLRDLISATRALHTHGLLAFGLTPSIIRLTTDGERLVMSSAGVAEIHEVLTREIAEPSSGEQPINDVAFYLAPELLVGEKPDGRADIFMIGAIGYELFTGRRLFEAKTLSQLVSDAFSVEIKDPRSYASSMPEAAALCLMRCLARRPDQRFSDAVELENAWSAVLSGDSALNRVSPA